MKVLTNTTLTTKAVLHAVSDGQFWKKSLTYLRPLNGLEQSSSSKSTKDSTTPGTGQGCQPFYESLIVNPFIAEGEATYTAYQYNSQESFAEVLLRTGKLAETKSEGDTLFPATEDRGTITPLVGLVKMDDSSLPETGDAEGNKGAT